MSDIYRSSAHNHTVFCDGKSTAEEMVLKALELGFVSLGFSGHGYSPYDPTGMPRKDEIAYREEVKRLQQVYGDRLEILLGVEHDSLMPYDTFAYDFMIESVHNLYKNRYVYSVDWDQPHLEEAIHVHGGDVYDYCKVYFEACAETYLASPAQIAGHLDLVCKFNEKTPLFDELDPRYLDPAFQALDCALEKNMVIEVNTGAMARGYKSIPYPAPAILKRVKEKGGQVMVNSDCHDANNLIFGYDTARELLLSCGFTSAVILRKHGFEEVGL
ncbi:MAG: histidinol-phosphatase HisJ family protein [Oscillospiraceae bacterium]|nr:histidinol-phosphatase HisJ family protein [Oscillospiraceae bacterium]